MAREGQQSPACACAGDVVTTPHTHTHTPTHNVPYLPGPPHLTWVISPDLDTYLPA